MLYKKIDNFWSDWLVNYTDDDMLLLTFVPFALAWLLTLPVWFVPWFISKFWNTPSN